MHDSGYSQIRLKFNSATIPRRDRAKPKPLVEQACCGTATATGTE